MILDFIIKLLLLKDLITEVNYNNILIINYLKVLNIENLTYIFL